MEYGVSITVNPMPVHDQSPALSNLSARSADGWRDIIGGGRSSAGVDVNARSAMGYPPLWRAINIIATRVASLPFDCFIRSGEERKYDASHAANKLFDGEVNPEMDSYTFMETITGHAAFFGNGYAVIDRDTRGRPVEMYLLDPDHNRTYPIEKDGKWFYITHIGAEQVVLPTSDVYHIKGLGNNGMVGHHIIDLMKDALGVGMAAQQHGGRFFGQGSNMGGLLMIPGSFSDEKIRNTINAWEKMTQGLQKAHKVALLQDGVKFQQLTVNPDQAQFLETRQFEIRGTVSNITGVPPHKLGDDTRTSHNSLEAENQSLLDDCLNPWLKRHEKQAGRKLLMPREKTNRTHFFEFNREALIQMSFETKINGAYRQLESGMSTHDEVRRLFNYPPFPNGEGKKRFRPANWVEIGAEGATNPVQTPPNQPAQPPQQPQNDRKQTILRAMVASSVSKALRIERDRVVMASRNPSGFSTSLDAFYSGWTDRFFEDLGWRDPGAVNATQAHISESRKQIEDVASVTTTGNLESAVKDVVACWDDRGQILIERLCEVAG